MPTRDQVRRLLGAGLDYPAVAERLGIPAGQAHLIATGRAADGSDNPADGESQSGDLRTSSQHLANPPQENPAGGVAVHEWIRARAAAEAAMRGAAEQRTVGPGEPGTEDASHDVAMVLTRDHNQVRTLVQHLSALPGHKNGGSPAGLSRRKSIVDMITVRLSQHEAAEEEHLWPAVRKVLPDGGIWADGALRQELESKETLTMLGRLGPDSDDFDSGVERLIAKLRKHVAYEEQVFLRLREAMPDGDREQLGERLLAARNKAPTRPRKRAPQKPAAAVKVAGAGAAAVDKVRDAAGDRPAKRKGKPAT